MRNIKVKMSYCGTNYHGFQRQINALAIQEVVESALSKLLNECITIYGCSRTDTGVHALEYFFNFRTEQSIPTNGILRGLNTVLPDDIVIKSCEDVEESFHARYSVVAKEYIYKIYNAPIRDPFYNNLALHYYKPLNVEILNKAGQAFIGTHDFAAFCSTGSDKENTVRTIYDFIMRRAGDEIIILVKGDGFLYNMIRIMVGTLLFINEGKIPVDGINEIILSKDRSRSGKTTKPYGLYLNKVYY